MVSDRGTRGGLQRPGGAGPATEAEGSVVSTRGNDPWAALHRSGKKKPLTAVFDRLGNNTTKAITACRVLARSDEAVLVLQRRTHGKVAICEAYPALWKTGGRKADPVTEEARTALAGCDLPRPGCDEADAVLSALAAACYDNQSRGLEMRLPELYLAEEEYAQPDTEANAEALVRQEGWIYFPQSARK